MSKLIHISDNNFHAPGIFAIGIIRYENKVILIDSGSDEQSAGNVIKILKQENLTPTAIINSHCHADHCGGNYFFQKQFPNIALYATKDEKFFIEDAKWTARCFCGNAKAWQSLETKLITLQHPTTITNILAYQDQTITIDQQSMKILTLPGHTPGSIGILTSDNILYSGDALFGMDTIQKHPVLLYTDIAQALETFEKIKNLQPKAIVLYHGGLIFDYQPLITKHIQTMHNIIDFIASTVHNNKKSVNQITQHVMQQFKIKDSIVAFTLTQTTVHAYLAYLEQQNKIIVIVENGILLIQNV